jgi:hypothetical protein
VRRSSRGSTPRNQCHCRSCRHLFACSLPNVDHSPGRPCRCKSAGFGIDLHRSTQMSNRFVIKPQHGCHPGDMLVNWMRYLVRRSRPHGEPQNRRARGLGSPLRRSDHRRSERRKPKRPTRHLARRSSERRGWDLNPRTPEGQCLSRASHSAALAPLHQTSEVRRIECTGARPRLDPRSSAASPLPVRSNLCPTFCLRRPALLHPSVRHPLTTSNVVGVSPV